MKVINVELGDDLQKIVDSAQEGSKLLLAAGTYRCKLTINKSLIISGNSSENTVITFDDHATKIHSDGREYNTFRTYTVCVLADLVTLENLTIQNSAGKGSEVGQAVALAVMGDMVKVINCRLKAHQDTLFTGALPCDLVARYADFLQDEFRLTKVNPRQYYHGCVISGDVDFIFGGANAVFDKCEIVSLNAGYVAAPSTPKECEFGFTFIDCYFNGFAPPQSVYLARPWRDYGKAVFINCVMGGHIKDEGFDHWQGTERYRTCRFYECNSSPSALMRAPYANQLAKEDVELFTPERIFGDW